MSAPIYEPWVVVRLALSDGPLDEAPRPLTWEVDEVLIVGSEEDAHDMVAAQDPDADVRYVAIKSIAVEPGSTC